MRSRNPLIYVLGGVVICLLFYWAVETTIQSHLDYQHQEANDSLTREEDGISEANDLKPGEITHEILTTNSKSVDTPSALVADEAKGFLQTYSKEHPDVYPVAAGQIDVLGNAWSYLMWDGERSEIILIYYDENQKSVVNRSIIISQEDFKGNYDEVT